MSDNNESSDIKLEYELHVCMGLNNCKGQGFGAKNDCAGQGECSTVSHPCHVLNECKGQGGCGLFGTTKEFCHPGENDCRYQGSCGAPILASRFIVQGPNKGTSVWQLARKRFEEKREANNLPVGKVPMGQDYGPTNEFLNTIKETYQQNYSSCGQSGDRHCSYTVNKKNREIEAADRQAKFEKKSADEMNNTVKNCCGND